MFRKKIIDAKEFKVGDEIVYCRLQAWQMPKKGTAKAKEEAGERQEEKPHNPRWTQQDIDDAKAVRRLYPRFQAVVRNSNEVKALRHYNPYENERYTASDIAFLDSRCFPNLKLCNITLIDDILKAEVDNGV